MYNTVGETAGVTQDVGSDPTVGGIYFEEFCCTLCGREMEGSCEEEEDMEDDEEEMEFDAQRDEKEKGVTVTLFDLSEISRMEEEEEEEDDDEAEECMPNDQKVAMAAMPHNPAPTPP